VEAEGLSPSSASASNPLTVPFVEGSESFGIRIPDIDSATGKMRSLLEIGALARVDDRLLEIKESFLQTYRPDGSPQFSIRFPKATLDRFTRRLKSHGPVLIWTENFQLDGVSMELDTVSKEAVFDGRVEMVIYQLGASLPSLGQGDGGGEGGPSAPASRSPGEAESSPKRSGGGPN
jgi:hypothetical protein